MSILPPLRRPWRRPLRTRLWVWKPSWYWHGWRTLSPILFGGDQFHYKTVVLGWTITGRVIVALHEFNDGECIECPPNPWADLSDPCCALAYNCPTTGEMECVRHGGFRTCCHDEYQCPGSHKWELID